jgi:hypothetical protein
MFRTLFFGLLWLAMAASITPAVGAPNLDDCKTSYTKMLQEIETESLGNLMSYPDEYLNAVETMAQAFQQKGDLEGWQAVTAEKNRFAIARTVSERDLVKEPNALRKMQLHYRESVKRTKLIRAKKIVAMTTRYIQTLENMQKKLTVDGKIEEALRVKTELQRVETSGEFVNSSKLLAEETKNEPKPDDKPAGQGIVKAGNVALAKRGAKASAPLNAGELNDGNTTKYDGKKGFAHGGWPCEFVVTLPEIYRLSNIRFLLWDGNRRSYRYKVEVSPDGKTWQELVDKSRGQWRSWQELKFTARPVKAIKVTGLHNTDNRGFHIVELEAYCRTPAQKVTPRWPSDRSDKRSGKRSGRRR